MSDAWKTHQTFSDGVLGKMIPLNDFRDAFEKSPIGTEILYYKGKALPRRQYVPPNNRHAAKIIVRTAADLAWILGCCPDGSLVKLDTMPSRETGGLGAGVLYQKRGERETMWLIKKLRHVEPEEISRKQAPNFEVAA